MKLELSILGNAFLYQRAGVMFVKNNMKQNFQGPKIVDYDGVLSLLHGGVIDKLTSKGLSRVFDFEKLEFQNFLPRGVDRIYSIDNKNSYFENRDDIYPSKLYFVHENVKIWEADKKIKIPNNPILWSDGFIRFIVHEKGNVGLEFYHFKSQSTKWRFTFKNNETQISKIIVFREDKILLNCSSSKLYIIDRYSGNINSVIDEVSIRDRDFRLENEKIIFLSTARIKEFDIYNNTLIRFDKLDFYEKRILSIGSWEIVDNSIFFIDRLHMRIGQLNYSNLEIIDFEKIPEKIGNNKIHALSGFQLHENRIYITCILETSDFGTLIYSI